MDTRLGPLGKNAQSGLEFSMLVVCLLFFMTFATVVIASHTHALAEEREKESLLEVLSTMHQELIAADSVRDGYERTVLLPEKIEGKSYAFTLVGGNLKIVNDEYEFDLLTTRALGTPTSGRNVITRTNGTICVNPPCI